jgi:hypothetical protein
MTSPAKALSPRRIEMSESRTRERALQALLKLLPTIREEIDDAGVRSLLSEALVREVFKASWDHQFDDDRTPAAREIRQIIRERLEGLGDD